MENINFISDYFFLATTSNRPHGVFLQKKFPSIIESSDSELMHRRSTNSWIKHKGLSSKMPDPLDLYVELHPLPINKQLSSLIKGIVCLNMIHISSWSCSNALFEQSKSYLD